VLDNVLGVLLIILDCDDSVSQLMVLALQLLTPLYDIYLFNLQIRIFCRLLGDCKVFLGDVAHRHINIFDGGSEGLLHLRYYFYLDHVF